MIQKSLSSSIARSFSPALASCSMPCPRRATVESTYRRALACEFFCKDRRAEVARLNPLHDAQLQDFHDFFHRRTGLQSIVDVPPRSRRVHVRIGSVEG